MQGIPLAPDDPANLNSLNQSKAPTDPVVPPVADPAKAADPAKPDEPPKPTEPVAPFTAADIKLPEGFEADPPTQEKFVGLVNKFGIPREAIPELVALQAQTMKAIFERGNELGKQAQEAMKAETMKDPEVGGANWDQTKVAIGRLLDQYGDPQTREAFEKAGIGNNLNIIKMLTKVARDLGEGSPVGGSPAGGGQRQPTEQVLYPSMNKGT